MKNTIHKNSSKNHILRNRTAMTKQSSLTGRTKVKRASTGAVALLLVLTTIFGSTVSGFANEKNDKGFFSRLAEMVGINSDLTEEAVPDPYINSPQLSKEYIYAGSRMLAIEDYQPTPTPTP